MRAGAAPARATLLLGLPLCLIAVLGATLASASDERVVVNFLITIVLALSIQVFSGTTGILSFGHVAFMGVGAYVGAMLTIAPALKTVIAPDLPDFIAEAELSLPLALLAALLIGGLVAAIVGVVFARMQEDAMAMATLSLLLMFSVIFQRADGVTGGPQGVYAIPRDTTIWIALAAALATVLLAQFFGRSRTGLQLAASRANPLAARTLGVRVERLRFVAWTAAGALIGFGGGLWAHYNIAFAPQEFGFDLTFTLLAALVVGGIASVTGSVVGVTVMTVLFEILRRIEGEVDLPGMTQILIAIIILLVLYRRPNGLLGYAELPEALSRLRRRSTPQPAPVGAVRSDVRPRSPVKARPGGGGLMLEGISKRFSGVQALDGVDLKLTEGEILGLIGPNGSGKTTLLGIASGVLRPTGGRVIVAGVEARGRGPEGLAALGVSRTFQQIRLFEALTVEQTVIVGALAKRRPTEFVGELLARFDLESVADRDATTLPYGAQRRVEIARAMAGEPRFLLLDEPAAGMNESETEELIRAVRVSCDESGCGVLIVDHDLPLIMNLCERVAVLCDGKKLAEDNPSAIQADTRVIEAYLGTSHGLTRGRRAHVLGVGGAPGQV